MRNYELGRDDWELDRGMDGIDDPDVPITPGKKHPRTNYTLMKKDGSTGYFQGNDNETDYIVTPDGKAVFIGDEIKERGLDVEIAQGPHTELPDEYIEIALREGDNRGHFVEDTEKSVSSLQSQARCRACR